MPPPTLSQARPRRPRPEPHDEPLDPRALKALSRQERKEAKSAIRREQKEARDAARRAKAEQKLQARAGHAEDVAPESPVVEAAEVVEAEAEQSTDTKVGDPTDPRSRAAQRVQRRLGRDAEKVSAAEARAKAREEARKRRAQAKELRTGAVAEEPVVRAPEEPVAPDAEDSEPEQPTAIIPVVADAAPVVEEPVVEEPLVEEPLVEEPLVEEPEAEEPVVEESVVEEPAAEEPVVERPRSVRRERPEPQVVKPTTPPVGVSNEPANRPGLASLAGFVGLVCLGMSVLLAVGALVVALGVSSGGVYHLLESVANALVGPLKDAFNFAGTNAERKEHFLAWGAGSIGYLLLSFAGQAVQRANSSE